MEGRWCILGHELVQEVNRRHCVWVIAGECGRKVNAIGWKRGGVGRSCRKTWVSSDHDGTPYKYAAHTFIGISNYESMPCRMCSRM